MPFFSTRSSRACEPAPALLLQIYQACRPKETAVRSLLGSCVNEFQSVDCCGSSTRLRLAPCFLVLVDLSTLLQYLGCPSCRCTILRYHFQALGLFYKLRQAADNARGNYAVQLLPSAIPKTHPVHARCGRCYRLFPLRPASNI